MTKLIEVFLFELGYHFRRASTLFYFLVVFALCASLMQVMAGGPRDDGSFNAPFTLLTITVFGSMLALVVMAAFAADAAARDTETRSDSLFYTSPVGKRAYVLGRFLGAFAMSALLLLAFPAGCLFATLMPWVDRSSLLPFHLSAYLAPYMLFALPNAFVGTALLFGAALLARRATAAYAAGALLFFAAMLCGKLVAPRLGTSLATLLDPLGFTTVNSLLLSLTPLQKNTFVAVLDDALVTSRLLWFAVATSVVAAAYARFRFAHRAAGHDRMRTTAQRDDKARAQSSKIVVPVVRRVFDASTRLRQLRAITTRSFAELHASRAWWIVPLLALLFVLQAPSLAKNELGVPVALTTTRLVGFLTGDLSILITMLIALSAGELVWRDRAARMHAVAGVTPVTDWVTVTGKFLGVAMMLAATLTIFLIAGLAVQTIYGAESDLALSIQLLFGLLLPEYLLSAALAMVLHALLNQKYVANVLLVLAPVARDIVRSLGLEDRLLLYGSLPQWTYSEIAGFGPSTEARLWFTAYFAGWALLFALATYLFWMRGEERSVRQRVALARRRLTGGAVLVAAGALAIIAGVGGFIAYETHVRHPLLTTKEAEEQGARYELRYGRYASLAQPSIAATKLHVEFYPERRAATIHGSYRLENRSSARIDTIHVATAGSAESTVVSFDRTSRLTLDDHDLDYRIYTLDRALAPGESLQMNFEVAIQTRVFESYVTPPVARNGSFITHRPRDGVHWLPLVGYQSSRELDDRAVRKTYGLRERPPYPRLGDVAAGDGQRGYETTDLETIIGTDAGQIGVAPGKTLRTWIENGRRYVHYKTERPITNAWTITSAKYAVHQAQWRSAANAQQAVDIEIFHHPEHAANLDRMVHAVQASLDYNAREFTPCPYREVRLVEFPSDASVGGMTAHAGLITYAEGFSFLRPAADPRAIDFPFAVVAHEMGHQWWGHQLTPARVEGAALLTESLAWYDAMRVIEQTFGHDHLQRLLDVMRADYLQPNQPRTVPLLRAVDRVDAYRRGPFVMHALRGALGADAVNHALRNLLAKFPPGHAPYPTSLDMYAELRSLTPPSMHGLLRDLFAEITFWNLTAKRMDVKPDGNGSYRVTLEIRAQKLKGDSSGAEHAVAMSDPVEILLYDANRKPLHRASHGLHTGTQTIELTVTSDPAGAIVDPEHLLLDRKTEDNEVRVEAARSR